MSSTYLHIDINSYFATLLQQETPQLRNRPLGIVKSAGRTCIIAASKEAKKLGVKTGSRVIEAQRVCPDIVLVPAEFNMYLSATRQLKEVFYSFSPDVEIFSLDESFMPFDPVHRLYKSPQELGYKIQHHIKKTLGEWVTCNVGIGPSKLLAKMTGEVAEKGSVTTVTDENKDALLATTSFDDVCGIGMRLEAKLAKLNVYHPYQINFIEDDVLELIFGPFWSVQLRRIAQGLDPHSLTYHRDTPHMKSISRSITGFKLAHTEETNKQILYNLCAEVIYKARKMNLAGRYVHVSLTGSRNAQITPNHKATTPSRWDHRTPSQPYWKDHVTLSTYIHHTRELYDVVYHQLCAQREYVFPVIKFRVGLSLLKPIDQVPHLLWSDWWKKEKVEQACDSITQRYGLFTVRPGRLLKANLIKPEVTGFLGDKDFYDLN